MPLAIRGRRLLYRVAFALLELFRPFVPREWGGVKCVILDGDRLLLVRHTYGCRAWDLPGGSRGRGESSTETANREMQEELGLPDLVWTSLGSVQARIAHHRQTVHVCLARTHAPELTLELAELSVAAWFELDRLPLELGPFAGPILSGAGLVDFD